MQNNSLFLWLSELVYEFTSPPVEHLPRVDDPRVWGGTMDYDTLQIKS